MHPLIQDLMSLFEGYGKAYGYYSGELTEADGKMVGKRASMTGDVTVELWERHVTGKMGLGIIPINERSEVKFAAIDVDDYTLKIQEINQVVVERKLPLVLCRTKSGGAHLYLFLTEFHDAASIQRKMREMASILGFGSSEIFPKQTQVNAARGDVGNWINMPYFDFSQTTRFALDARGKKLSLENFIKYAQSLRIEPGALMKLKFDEEQHLLGGPPCLNHLIGCGFPPGTRNNGLLNLGVYAKKLMPTGWEALVEEYNRKFMNPPLEAPEVIGIIKSLQKKDFFYMCKQPPIAQYCNMPKCRACKFGIGTGDMGMPKLGTLTKLKTDPPIWFIEIEGGGRIELSTDDLQNQRRFQNRCMETLNVMPIIPNNEVWQGIVSSLLSNCNEVDVPEEATPTGMLKQHLEDFCTSRVQAKNPDEMLNGKPWTSGKFHYFRMRDFMEFLDRKKFSMPKPFVAMHLRDWGAQQKFWNLKGKGTNTYYIREFEAQNGAFEVPNQKQETPY